jgi:tripartite-type tricarboxylate transporter receptor subunit TctC
MFVRRDFLKLAGAGAVSLAAGRRAIADAYPSKSVRVIVPFAPGGPSDSLARVIMKELGDRLGQQFYIENIAGAGANIGTAEAAKAAPDGYTIEIVTPSFAINPTLYAKAPYDPKQFDPISIVVTSPTGISVHPSVQAKTMKELIADIKASPGKYSYAHPGVGTPPHLVGELMRLTLGLDLVGIPFGGGGPAIVSTLGNHTPMTIGGITPAIQYIKDGKLRALALASSQHLETLPDVPTMAEAGFPGLEGDVWMAALVPAGTPKDIIERLNHEIVSIVKTPEIRKRLLDLGDVPIGNTPDEARAHINAEITKWAKVIKDANIKPEGM